MKTIFLFLAVFLATLGGLYLGVGGALEQTASLAADSAIVASADSSSAPDSSAISSENDGAPAEEADTANTPETASEPEVSANEQAVRDSLAAVLKATHERFGKIFANMSAPEAAQVMAELPDDVVRGLLNQFSARKAAEVVSEMPQERAARLTAPFLPSLSDPTPP